jgi:cytoskeletal protein CcmA (bactofilin family)
MFNKREHEQDSSDTPRAAPSTGPGNGGNRAVATGSRAVIGPTISVNGELKGQEDLIVEGTIEGTVELKQNTLTIGSQGTLKAQVYAHTILVDGTVNGDLYASERISIRKSARIEGNILAPRISLEDGAKFRGTIDMDAESEAFTRVFKPQTASPSQSRAARPADKPAEASKAPNAPGQPDKGTTSGKTAGKPTQSTA